MEKKERIEAGGKAVVGVSESDVQESIGASGPSPASEELSDEQLDAVSGGRARLSSLHFTHRVDKASF